MQDSVEKRLVSSLLELGPSLELNSESDSSQWSWNCSPREMTFSWAVPWAGSEAMTSRWKSPYPITNPITWCLQVRWELPDRNSTMDHLVLCLVSDSSRAWEPYSDTSHCQSADTEARFPLNEGIEPVMEMGGSGEAHYITIAPIQSQPSFPYSLIHWTNIYWAAIGC